MSYINYDTSIIDTTDKKVTRKPRFISEIAISPASPRLFVISPEGVAYIFTTAKTLHAIKIQQIENLQQIGTPLDLSTQITGDPVEIVKEGSELYILDSDNKVYKINVKDNGTMVYLATFSDAGLLNATGLALYGGYILVAGDNGVDKGVIYYINRTTFTSIFSEFKKFESTTFRHPVKARVQSNYLICTTAPTITLFKLEIFDINDLSPSGGIIEKGKVDLEQPFPGIWSLEIQGNIAYISGTGWVIFVDYSDPDDPIKKGEFYDPDISGAIDIAIWGRYFTFLSVNFDLIGTVDIEDLLNPEKVDEYVYSSKVDAGVSILMYGSYALTIAIGGSSNKLVAWDVNGYTFPPIQTDGLRVRGKLTTDENVKIGNNLSVKGDISTPKLYVADKLSAKNIESLNFPSNVGGTAIFDSGTTVMVLNKITRIDFGTLRGGSAFVNYFDIHTGSPPLRGNFTYLGTNGFFANLDFQTKLANQVATQNIRIHLLKGNSDNTIVSVASATLPSTLTFETSLPHGYSVGNGVVIEDTGSYDGTYSVAVVVNPTTFEVIGPGFVSTTTGYHSKNLEINDFIIDKYYPDLDVSYPTSVEVLQEKFGCKLIFNKNDYIFFGIRPATTAGNLNNLFIKTLIS